MFMDITLVGSKFPTSWHVPRSKYPTMKALEEMLLWKNSDPSQPHVKLACDTESVTACDMTSPDYTIFTVRGETHTILYDTGTPTHRSKCILKQLMALRSPMKGVVGNQVFKLNSNSRQMALAMFIMMVVLQEEGGNTTFEFCNEIFHNIQDILYTAHMLYEKMDISITPSSVRVSLTNFVNPVSDKCVVKLLCAYKYANTLRACCEVPLFFKQAIDESDIMMRVTTSKYLATTMKPQVVLSQSRSDRSIQNVFQQSER